MKSIEVVAAVIRKEKKIFATQRGYGQFKDWWEFPGGKIEKGEIPVEALKREIKEELDAEILVGNLIKTIEWDYPDFHLRLHCFWCELNSEDVVLVEHESAKWLSSEELYSVKWLPADIELLPILREEMEK